MSNLINLSFKSFQHYESKFFMNFFKSNVIKKNVFIINLLKLFLIIFVFNILVFSPAFFVKHIFAVKYFSIVTPALFILTTLYFFLKTISLEKLDKTMLSTSIFKEDFIRFLKKDFGFNIKFSMVCGLVPFFYVLINYSIILSLGGISYINMALFTAIYLAVFLLIPGIINLVFYLKNKELKEVFFHVENYREIKYIHLLFLGIIFLIFTSIILAVVTAASKNFILSLTISIVISAILAVITNSYFDKKGLYNKNNWILFFNRLKNESSEIKSGGKLNLIFVFRSLRFLIPVMVFIVAFAILNLSNPVLKLSTNVLLIQCFLLPMLLIYPAVKEIISSNILKKRALTFTVFVFSIIFILNFFNTLQVSEIFKKESLITNFKDIFVPLFTFYNSIYGIRDTFINGFFFLFTALVIPLFFSFYLINFKFLELRRFLEKRIDKKLTSKLNGIDSGLIFGDSVSKYPFIFSLIVNFLIISVLLLELQNFSNFISGIIDTLQIASIFKFKFLTRENIDFFFNTLAGITVALITLKLAMQLVSSFLSHFMLFTDEIVYVENKIFSNIILRIPVTKVNYIIIRQNIIEKLLDIGTIFIETSDKNGMIKIKSISSIKDKNKEIMEKIKIGLQKI